MPGCAALNCSNSSKKGFLMRKFPRDPKRREEWRIRTGRGQWKPSDSTVLCEVHFEPHMWEKPREDGTRKLKLNAVPTLFNFDKPKSKLKSLLMSNSETKVSINEESDQDLLSTSANLEAFAMIVENEEIDISVIPTADSRTAQSFLTSDVPKNFVWGDFWGGFHDIKFNES